MLIHESGIVRRIVHFKLLGQRLAKFTCLSFKEETQMSPEPMKLKVREPGRNFPHTQGKCQGKRSLQSVPEGHWQSSTSCQSLAPTAHESTHSTSPQPPAARVARPQHPADPALKQHGVFLESPMYNEFL